MWFCFMKMEFKLNQSRTKCMFMEEKQVQLHGDRDKKLNQRKHHFCDAWK